MQTNSSEHPVGELRFYCFSINGVAQEVARNVVISLHTVHLFPLYGDVGYRGTGS